MPRHKMSPEERRKMRARRQFFREIGLNPVAAPSNVGNISRTACERFRFAVAAGAIAADTQVADLTIASTTVNLGRQSVAPLLAFRTGANPDVFLCFDRYWCEIDQLGADQGLLSPFELNQIRNNLYINIVISGKQIALDLFNAHPIPQNMTGVSAAAALTVRADSPQGSRHVVEVPGVDGGGRIDIPMYNVSKFEVKSRLGFTTAGAFGVTIGLPNAVYIDKTTYVSLVGEVPLPKCGVSFDEFEDDLPADATPTQLRRAEAELDGQSIKNRVVRDAAALAGTKD